MNYEYVTVSDAYEAIVEKSKTGNAGKDLFDYLDQNNKMNNQAQNLHSSIRALTVADVPCPPVPTCLGTINALVNCGRGLQNFMRSIGNNCKPVRMGIVKGGAIATVNTTGTFTDQSASLISAKECVTLVPKMLSITLKLDSRTETCNDICFDLSKFIIEESARAIFLGKEQDLMTTLTANAGAVMTGLTGDVIDQLLAVHRIVRNAKTNRNKKIIGFVNQSVIDKVKEVRDDNRNPIYPIDRCPVTGCETICVMGMELVAIDDAILPVNTTTNFTNAYFVCVDNVFTTSSPVVSKSKTWEECCLDDMMNKVVTMSYVASTIPTIFVNAVKVGEIFVG